MAEIIVTVWPAISTPERLIELYNLGVRILRLNFTHYNPYSVAPMLDIIAQAESKLDGKFQLMMDLEWPSIRTWNMDKSRTYKKWEKFKLFVDASKSEENSLFCDYQWVVKDSKIWGIIRIESGLFDCLVVEKWADFLLLEALNDFEMTSRRHINLPGVHVDLPTITNEDKENVLFAIKSEFSYVAISFCRSESDVRLLRNFLSENGWNQIKIISKIENQEWLDNIDSISEASDVVMVARWDLGTELSLEDLPEAQMKIIKTCKIKNTKVIVATQMMASMVSASSPTRAEVSDVFRAVREWADYLMLSEETAVGQYPIQVVDMMKKIIEEAESEE